MALNKVTVILWLDDIRNPHMPEWESMVPSRGRVHSVAWVRDYSEFISWIEHNGLPDVISFDHDLGMEHYVAPQYWSDYYSSSRIQEKADHKEKTGYDCAKWLIEYCLDKKTPMPETHVHSANPVGADNIRGLILNFIKHHSI
jgi:hypothetical protein